jgi:hypothetical protein
VRPERERARREREMERNPGKRSFFLRSGCGDRADGDSRRGCVPSRDKLFFVVRSTESTYSSFL